MPSKETKEQIEDSNLQFVVLLTLIIERIEFLEKHGYIYGTIKAFLKNGKTKFEEFIQKVFQHQGAIEGNDATQATNKLLVMQERVELALVNQYILTVDERRDRTRIILREFVTAPFVLGDNPARVEARKDLLIDDIIDAMANKNLFNL